MGLSEALAGLVERLRRALATLAQRARAFPQQSSCPCTSGTGPPGQARLLGQAWLCLSDPPPWLQGPPLADGEGAPQGSLGGDGFLAVTVGPVRGS